MNKRILIVDDHDRVAFFLREGLADLASDSAGNEYEVQILGSGEQALEQIRHHRFDLLIVDFRLPGINGLDVIRQARDLAPTARSILITAYGSSEIDQEAQRLQACQCLHKPFRLQDLIHTVRQAMQNAQP